MITFLKGLLVFFLLAPYAVYIVNGLGNGDTNDMIRTIKESNLFMRIYLIYYPLVGLILFVGYILFLVIYMVGSEVTIF